MADHVTTTPRRCGEGVAYVEVKRGDMLAIIDHLNRVRRLVRALELAAQNEAPMSNDEGLGELILTISDRIDSLFSMIEEAGS